MKFGKHIKNLGSGILASLLIAGIFMLTGVSVSAEFSVITILLLLIYFEIWDLNDLKKENK